MKLELWEKKWNASGYFKDADTLVVEMKKLNTRGNANFYITLNNINAECYSRNQCNKFIDNAKPVTSDTDIVGYEWLMVDLDPKRASGTSSSNEQVDIAKAKANKIYSFTKSIGFNNPACCISGNGCHLLYKIKLANKKENTDLVQNCLKALDMLFSDDVISVDLANFNPQNSKYVDYDKKAYTYWYKLCMHVLISSVTKLHILSWTTFPFKIKKPK